MQYKLFCQIWQFFGLEISIRKTEVLHQPAPEVPCQPPSITIDDTALNTVDKFTYLGCTISSDAKIDKELDNRLGKANRAFEGLYHWVWKNQNLRRSTKTCVYQAIVLTTLLYDAETWVTYRAHIRLLERFHQRCLRTILGIHWMEHYRLPKRILYGQLALGHRNRGAPKKRYKDTITLSLIACGIDQKD